MAITRWNDPFRGLSTMHRDLDDMLSSLFEDTSATADSMPNMDVYIEDDDRLVADVYLPGFSPEDVEIRVQDDVLEIRGEQQTTVEDEDRRRRGYLLRQSVERFFRRITLPENADRNNVEADFEDGVLHVVVPFVQERQGKKVDVGTGSNRSQKKSTDKSKSASK